VILEIGGFYLELAFQISEWVGLLVPPGLVLFGTVLPKVGRLLGKSNERFILEHVQNTLAARIEDVA
jgi:hypothetical protein